MLTPDSYRESTAKASQPQSAEHPHTGPVVRNAEELRQLIAEKEPQRGEQSALTLNEEPPKPEKA